MTQEEAVLYQKVYIPAFLSKAAELGLDIRDEASLNEALELTAGVKQALQAQHGHQIKQANAMFKKTLGLPQRNVEEAQARQAANVKQASAVLMQDPAVLAAARALVR